MSSEEFGLSIRSVAELALMVSRSSGSLLDETEIPTIGALRLFWQSSRRLQKRWTHSLDDRTAGDSLDIELLEGLLPRVFVCEMLVRTFSTILAAQDRSRGTEDLTSVARNVCQGLMQIRHRVLSDLLALPDRDHERVMNLDRLRRRCDRWTDLLLGPIATEYDCFQFAFDAERARDFGEDADDFPLATDAINHLVSAGMRLTFLHHFASAPIDEPEFAGLMRSILSCFATTSFQPENVFRSLLEMRIVATEHRNQVVPRR